MHIKVLLCLRIRLCILSMVGTIFVQPESLLQDCYLVNTPIMIIMYVVDRVVLVFSSGAVSYNHCNIVWSLITISILYWIYMYLYMWQDLWKSNILNNFKYRIVGKLASISFGESLTRRILKFGETNHAMRYSLV